MRNEYFREIFEKFLNIKFHENSFSGSRVVLCGQKNDMKVIVAFRNFADAPENERLNVALNPQISLTSL